MIYFKEEKGIINLNGKVYLTVEEFKILEPSHDALLEDYHSRLYVPNQTHVVYGNNQQVVNLPLNWEDGNRYLQRFEEFVSLKKYLSQKITEENSAINEALQSQIPYDSKRKFEYPLYEELVVALWEHIVENKSLSESNIEKIQKIRKSIKDKYPKEVK